MPTVLGPDAWAEIRTAYIRGHSARALGLRWGVSTSAIYRRAVQEGWAKSRTTPAFEPTDEPDNSPAHRLEAPANDGDLPDLVGEVLKGEVHEPGFLARIAIGASGDALRNYEFEDARKLIRLANDYARVAERTAQINLHTVLRALFDRAYADALFAIEEGEHNLVKDLYWTEMGKVDARTAAKEAAAAAASTPVDAR